MLKEIMIFLHVLTWTGVGMSVYISLKLVFIGRNLNFFNIFFIINFVFEVILGLPLIYFHFNAGMKNIFTENPSTGLAHEVGNLHKITIL